MSNSRYTLRIRVLGQVPELDIEKSEFLELKESKFLLDHALAIEEKYEILLANYFDFEKTLLEIIASNMVSRPEGYGDIFEYRLAINTRLVNLLTSARLYLDHLGSHVKRIQGASNETEVSIDRLITLEFEKNESYRFMEALRNYVQHAGLAVHFTSLISGWKEKGENSMLEFNIQVAADRALLEADGKFKAAVLAEIPARVDLTFAVRSYVESLSTIHSGVRELVEERVKNARGKLEETKMLMQKYMTKS